MSERRLRTRFNREMARARLLGADEDELAEICSEWNEDPPADDDAPPRRPQAPTWALQRRLPR